MLSFKVILEDLIKDTPLEKENSQERKSPAFKFVDEYLQNEKFLRGSLRDFIKDTQQLKEKKHRLGGDGGRHSTEVAFALLTQPTRVQFLAFPRFFRIS